MALFDCAINEKCCSVDGRRGICPLFSSPPGGFDSLRVPTPWNLPSKAKKNAKLMLNPGGCWAQLELTDALSVQEISENGLSMACDLHLCSLFLLAEKKERIRFV